MSVVKRHYRQTARAAAAGTTRQTVIRLFGSKDGLLEAVLDLLRAEAVPRISMPAHVSPRAAVEVLIAHYEAVGDMVVRFLTQEERHPALRPLLAQGRQEHRAWVSERFNSMQSGLSGLERERQITRLVVATDIYTWKLLRRDFGKTQDEVFHLMVGIINKEMGEVT